MANEKITFSQKNVILDIGGTIVSVDFIKNVYLKFVANKLKENIEDGWNNKYFQLISKSLRQKFAENVANNIQIRPTSGEETEKESFIKNIHFHMQLGKSSNAHNLMRALEEHILKMGFTSGELPKLEVFEDVPAALKLWKEKGKNIYLYASGKKEDQKNFFGATTSGNLSQFFAGYFDLNIYPTTNPASYAEIANIIGSPTNDIIFVTDIPKDAATAVKAGCTAVIAERPGNIPYTPDDRAKFKFINSLDQLVPES